MALINWDGQLSIGVPEIDLQHKRLVEMVNQLHEAMTAGKGQDVMKSILGNLVTYTATHFKTEERLMQQCQYAGFEDHRRQHDELTAKVYDLQQRFGEGKTRITLEVMKFLTDWLKGHIIGSDKKYVPAVKAAMVGAKA